MSKLTTTTPNPKRKKEGGKKIINVRILKKFNLIYVSLNLFFKSLKYLDFLFPWGSRFVKLLCK